MSMTTKTIIVRFLVAILIVCLVAYIATKLKEHKENHHLDIPTIEVQPCDTHYEMPSAELLSDDSGIGEITRKELIARELAEEPPIEQQVQESLPPKPLPTGDITWFRAIGVTEHNGFRVTWYNPSALGTSYHKLCITTLGCVAELRADGVVTVDGYIAVAMPSNYVYGTIIDTPFGAGIVADHSEGAMDIMTGW